ncbi:FadR/GntR family transcriptional regulator [Rhizobium sp. 1399]|jgi:GntR family uxuAB operon transcriptional repressor|uniref:FadR/GntR family transcriptional regulator n=1 Tax=Rhizobium sp. 1399 TaxID=2817758 RepID=UPI002862C803|nr:FadR/GntR family transcriptional regulator [Rhizobium sp. 1399]MDR6665754.1 GntR family uxuAB operon transcriptional repressor [Rhizobium sp. 1399]
MEFAAQGFRIQGEQRLYQIVARRIARMIEANTANPDWRMPSERELAEELQVSRPVVREAVIALEMRGIVEVKGRAGIVVLPARNISNNFEKISADIGPGPFELLEARLAVESSAAAMAAERATNYDILVLEECIAQMEQETNVMLLKEKGDRDFHMTIARMTGNAIIVSIVEALWAQRDESVMWRKLHEHIHAPSVRPLWIGDHHAVLTALRLRNPDAAYKAMARHIRNVSNELMDAYERGRFSPDIMQLDEKKGL